MNSSRGYQDDIATFDDGQIDVYRTMNTAANGAMPVETPTLLFSEYFGFSVLGASRYYAALQANQQIELVVDIPDWPDVNVTDLAKLQDGIMAHEGIFYRIVMVQPQTGMNGLRFTRLSLAKVVK